MIKDAIDKTSARPIPVNSSNGAATRARADEPLCGFATEADAADYVGVRRAWETGHLFRDQS